MRDTIDSGEARRLAVAASGLGRAPGSGAAGAASALRRLGAVQIDTISVVERAHHHILWSRLRRYKAADLARLEAEPRAAFEYWSHAAAYLPMAEYPYCLSRMERIRAQGHEWFRAEAAAVDYVRARVAEEGPLRAQDFEEPMKGARGWWDWKPAKVALEYLFHAGELAVVGRRGFQKVYDLAERALPAALAMRRPSPRDEAAHHLDRAVASLGVFSRNEIAYLRKDGLAEIDAELAARLEAGSLVELRLGPGASRVGGTGKTEGGGRSNPSCYAAPAALEDLAAEPARPAPRVIVLSPFDPLVIDRRRLLRLFGLDYQLECYVPEAKRRFGYFALPLLYRDGRGDWSVAALLDARADRKTGLLELKRLTLEPFFADTARGSRGRRSNTAAAEALPGALAKELARFAAFNGAERLALGRLDCPDEGLARALTEALTAVRPPAQSTE
ncbi:MAG: YcaQ family DNA glycosylase [Spirochaetaceae bacterium]|nr:YcaQ family DNA glycosylase [Spirochaetaceae bacterium]